MSAGTTTFPTTLDANTVRTNADEITSTDHNDHSVQIEAIEAKVGVNSSAITTSHDYKLSGVTGTDKAVSKTGTETLTNKTLTSPSFQGSVDGWISANETWTYASATTITVPTDATTKYSIGDKIRFQNNDSGTYLYAYIVTVAATLLTVVGDTVPNAVLTDNYYSKSISPLNFPSQFAWTSTVGGAFSSVTLNEKNFMINGRWVFFQLCVTGTAAAAAQVTYTLPVTASNANQSLSGGVVRDAGSGGMTGGCISKLSSTSIAELYKTDLSNWSAGGSRIFFISGQYRI